MCFIVGEINADVVYEQLQNVFDGVIDLIWLIICPQNASNQRTFLAVENSIARLFNISKMYTKIKHDSCFKLFDCSSKYVHLSGIENITATSTSPNQLQKVSHTTIARQKFYEFFGHAATCQTKGKRKEKKTFNCGAIVGCEIVCNNSLTEYF